MSVSESSIERARGVDLVELIRQHGVELRQSGAEYMGLCPFHVETTPSFSINPIKGVYYCHACRASGDSINFIIHHVGLDFVEAVKQLSTESSTLRPPGRAAVLTDEWEYVVPIPEDAPPPPVGIRVRADGQWTTLSSSFNWIYRNATGAALFHVQRFEEHSGKTFRPASLWRNTITKSVEWRRKGAPGLRPLYGLDLLAMHPKAQVLIVEGERAADAARRLLVKINAADKVVAITWLGGANSVRFVDLEPLRNREVIVWPDADEAGEHAADELVHCLINVAKKIKRVKPPEGVNLGWDAANAEQNGEFDLEVFAKTSETIWPAAVKATPGVAPEINSTSQGDTASTVPDEKNLDQVQLHLILPPAFSEDALAIKFVERASKFRWSPGLDWMLDDGVTWAKDKESQRSILARSVCRAEAYECQVEAEGKRITSARTVNAVLSLAQTDRKIVVAVDAWDKDPMALNTPSGIVDLRNGELRRRGAELVTQVVRVGPDSSIACPTWHRFLAQIFQADVPMIEFIQRSMGYWMTGDRREQVVHFLYGLGANGKSVLTEFIQWLGGSYTLKLPSSVLMEAKGERHPTELAQMRGKRLAVSSELQEGAFFNESLLKELTGDTTISARFMRGDFFEFQMSQKHVIVGNYKPRLRGGDHAIQRRMLLVPFNASFTGNDRDPHILKKLKAEAPSILSWIIEGAVMWNIEGLAVPQSVLDASADYMSEHDDLGLWTAECCVLEMSVEAKASHLYASFSRWKKARGEHVPTQTAWGTRLSTMTGIDKRRSGGIRYSGIRLSAVEQTNVLSEFR